VMGERLFGDFTTSGIGAASAGRTDWLCTWALFPGGDGAR